MSRTAEVSCRAAVADRQSAQGMEVVEVDLGTRTYPIYIGSGLLGREDGALLRRHVVGSSALVVTNSKLAGLLLDQTVAALKGGDSKLRVETVVLPDGEAFKNIEVLQKIWDAALEHRLDRNTTFVALGGGVIGDMTGFAAASYQRGVAFIQVPTTVMAQVDSSVGGKTGVNHPLGKNMIGAFHQPQCVLVDTDALRTLPDRELCSGISEIVKYGLIRDAPFFDWLEASVPALLARDPAAWATAVRRSCENKAAVVAADEREGGAVAAGTAMAADLSRRLGWIEPEVERRVLAILRAIRQPVAPPPGLTPEQFLRYMGLDKKVLDGRLRLVLLKGPLGNCVITDEYDPALLRETLEAFCGEM
ncbi:hypothetical protein QBZ16_002614 [Prototheca wickerhamii]|uniref:3-dehydroquinate synthase n=1 Tax=Prototheca wickerhamii TaxID=3111 RepID=A0AAD9IKM1_PROWI|nr:hypothetical protein QBZ16_002614 [Prototheca wickerhamii]